MTSERNDSRKAAPANAVAPTPARRSKVPIAPEGLPFIGAALLLPLALLAVAPWPFAFLALAPALFVAWFFRDPERRGPGGDGLLLSPADGRIELICEMPPPEGLGLPPAARTRISVFMSPLNVHVNRAPAAGRVAARLYVPGRFHYAALDKASSENERLALRLDLSDPAFGGDSAVVVQIAGWLARRIVCRVAEGALLVAGERYGLIRFGSRVDLYLPAGTSPAVALGDQVVAGETIIARRG